MVPTQVNNPKPSYCLLSEKTIVAIYYPLMFTTRNPNVGTTSIKKIREQIVARLSLEAHA